MRAVVLVFVISSIVAVGCSDSVDTGTRADDAAGSPTAETIEDSDDPTAFPSNTQRAPATATTAPPSEFNIGDAVRVEFGALITLHSFDAPVASSNQFSVPDPGNIFAVIDVEGCLDGSASGSMDYNPFDFELQTPDNRRYDAAFATILEPELHATTVLPGDCVRGFVNFEIPESAGRPLTLIYDGRGPTFQDRAIIKWTIP